MARTKASRGVKAFELRSGPESPYPFLGKVAKALTGGIGSILTNLLRGNKNEGDPSAMTEETMEVAPSNVGGNDSDEKLELIKEIAAADDEGGVGTSFSKKIKK